MVGSSGTQLETSDRLAHWDRSIWAMADRAAEILRRYKYVILLLFSSLYLLATCYRASRKLFWFDELFSVYISRLPNLATVWSVIKQGLDLNPPLFYAFTQFSESLFGEGHIATRLPEILGFWIFCLCLFHFVSSRTSVLAGLISMLFPLVTTAYYYAYEARPHGVVLGFCGIALLCWQAATRAKPRYWWLVGLFGALFCAILNHTYAIMIIVPLAMGELVRSVTVRRIDWPVGLALVFSLSAVSFSLPQWRTAKTLPVLFSPAKGSALAKAYQFHLGPAAGVLAAGLFLYFLFKFAAPSRTEAPKREQSLEPFEVVALLMFVLMPFLAFVLARVTGAPLFGRYSISTVGGFACLFGVVSARRAPVGLGVLFILITQIGLNLFDYSNSVAIIEPSTSLALNTTPYAFAARYEMMETVPNKNLPIVFLDDFEFLPLVHYAPPKLASRLVYILVPGLDVNGESQRVLQRLSGAPGKIDTMANFLSTHDAFLVQSNARSLYRLNYFIQEGGDVRVENASTDSFLASVTIKKGHGELAFNMLQ